MERVEPPCFRSRRRILSEACRSCDNHEPICRFRHGSEQRERDNQFWPLGNVMPSTCDSDASCLRIPMPRDGSVALLQAASVRAPEVLPHLETRVVTRRLLPSQRKAPVPTTT